MKGFLSCCVWQPVACKLVCYVPHGTDGSFTPCACVGCLPFSGGLPMPVLGGACHNSSQQDQPAVQQAKWNVHVVIRKSNRFLCVHKKDYPAKQPPSQPSIQPPNQPTTHPASHPTDQPNTREKGRVAKQLVISLISPSSLIITFDQFL